MHSEHFDKMQYSINEIARIVDAEAHIHTDDVVTIPITDSRQLDAGCQSLFFAISTRGNDGHRYIASLYRDKGVRNFVVKELPSPFPGIDECNFLIVANPLKALQMLAEHRRNRFEGQMVAVTGTIGKTTVKEWLFQMLEPLRAVTRSPRSYNSQIGVPLSLLGIDLSADVAIIESGTSKRGEMDTIERMVRPDIVVITNVCDSQEDSFRDIDDNAAQKAILAADAGIVVYCADNEAVSRAVGMLSDNKLMLGWSRFNPEAAIYVSSVERRDQGVVINYRFRNQDESAYLPFVSDTDIENAIHSIAVMLALGVEPALIDYRLRNVNEISTRLNVSDGVNGCLLIFDSFTADFSSLTSALDFMYRRGAADDRSRTLILSDLHHDNMATDESVEALASLVHRAGITRFIGVGPALSAAAEKFPEGSLFFPSTDALMEAMSTSDFSSELILIKGAPEYHFQRILRNLEARTHETVLEVNLDAIVKNYNYFRAHLRPATGIVAMVKASGYGAGSYEIAKTLQSQGAAYLAVAVLDEGIDLRRAGITMPIMVMNPKVVNYKAMFEHHLEPEIYSLDMLRDVVREARKYGVTEYPVHIKLDTGMHRMGFDTEELDDVLQVLNSQNYIVASTIFSHLATADCPDMDDYTMLQLSCFARDTEYIMSRYPRPVKRHILNSAGILRFPEHQYDFVRLGIGLYGANTLPPSIEKPLAVVSTLRTMVISVKERRPGDTIGYARRGVCDSPRRIATIPIGYADGMNRRFGNGRSRVYINGCYAPTIGNICMDACMIDVTGIPCEVGDTVEIFGPNLSVNDLADILGTIPYEILTSVSPRVKRVYYRE